MKLNEILTACLCAAAILLPGMANAQATRTWISGVGDDVNPCSRTAPCKTFAGAISKTAAGGEIDTLDPGGFGGVTVTKSITLADEGAGEAGILVAGTNGITVNCATDPNCNVVIRGLVIDGGPPGSNSLNGIRFVAGKSLTVENVVIRNFTGGSPNGYGIQFNPNSAAELHVRNTTIINSGQGTAGGGIMVLPQTGGSAKVEIDHVSLSNNTLGIRFDTTNASGPVTGVVSNTITSSNAYAGMTAFSPTSGQPVRLDIVNSVSSNNGANGVNANGANATVRISGSTITNNTNSVNIQNSATVTSAGNNLIIDNPSGPSTALTIAPLL